MIHIYYKTSQDYKHLKELLDKGYDVICYITYSKPFRTTDICIAQKTNTDGYSFFSRGTYYDQIYNNEIKEDVNLFEKVCNKLQIEYIEPTKQNESL